MTALAPEKPSLTRDADVSSLADRVAAMVASAVAAGIAARGHANLVFSGGSTPQVFLPCVAALPLDWTRVNVTLADERWVDESTPDSNTAMLRRLLLDHPNTKGARFIALKTADTNATEGAAKVREALPPASEPYDMVFLGMGNDGHFASLFPGAPNLASHLSLSNTERVVGVPAPTTATPAVPRITLTLAELTRASRIVLVLQGQAKLDVLMDSLARDLPIAHLCSAINARNEPQKRDTQKNETQNIEVLWCP
jgi:6-phosphogluconolactonase